MMNNTTLSSSPDDFGHRYWSSFDYSSFAKGDRFKAFDGKLNGHGPRSGDISVVKIFRNRPGSERMCDVEINKSRKAKELARRFANLYELKPHNKINFVSLVKATIDDISLFMPGSRKLSKSEWVLIEERVCTKQFKTFMNKRGKCCSNLLEAFAHFTYQESGGKLVLCGLKGCHNNTGYDLISPAIHSVDGRYGECDKGSKGISLVFDNHVCNEICAGMIKPDMFEGRRRPSAPLDPDLLFHLELEPEYLSPIWRQDSPLFSVDPARDGEYLLPSPPPYQLYPDLTEQFAYPPKYIYEQKNSTMPHPF